MYKYFFYAQRSETILLTCNSVCYQTVRRIVKTRQKKCQARCRVRNLESGVWKIDISIFSISISATSRETSCGSVRLWMLLGLIDSDIQFNIQ